MKPQSFHQNQTPSQFYNILSVCTQQLAGAVFTDISQYATRGKVDSKVAAGLTPPENIQSPTDQAPQPLQECTDVSQLDAGLTPPENIQSPTDHAPSKRMRCGPTRLEKDYSLQPLPTPDRRIFFWQNKRATLQSVPATIEDPQPICSSQAIADDPYVFIPFGCNFGIF